MARTHDKYEVMVGDREVLEALLRSPKTAQSLALRARIVLLSSSGQTAEEVVASLATTTRSVYKWRKRFKSEGLEGLGGLAALRAAQKALCRKDQ